MSQSAAGAHGPKPPATGGGFQRHRFLSYQGYAFPWYATQVSAMSVSGVGQIDNQLRVADGESHQADAPLEEVEQPICFRETSRPRSSAMLASAQAASSRETFAPMRT